jgi:hypothetical protein
MIENLKTFCTGHHKEKYGDNQKRKTSWTGKKNKVQEEEEKRKKSKSNQ